MLHQVFDHPSAHGALVIAAKTAVIYAFLIAGLRLLGKRELGQMSLYDLVLIIILGNAVQNAMINNDNTLVGGLVAANSSTRGRSWSNRCMRSSMSTFGRPGSSSLSSETTPPSTSTPGAVTPRL